MVVMRAAVRAESLCSEAVGAWLEANGIENPFSRRRQMAIWARGVNVFQAAAAAAQRIGLERIHGGCARDGDVVLFQQAGGITMGVAYRGNALAAAGGKVVVQRAQFLAAWRVRR